MSDDVDELAGSMWAAARDREQCVRRIGPDRLAEQVRARVRRLAAAEGVRVRTARIDDTVVVVRLDARVWSADAATMRGLLTPDR